MSINSTMNTLILARKYNGENLNERDEFFFDPNQFEILGKKKQKSKSNEILRESRLKKKLRERELQKPLCVEINRKEFEELTRDIYNGRHNNDFKIIMQKTL